MHVNEIMKSRSQVVQALETAGKLNTGDPRIAEAKRHMHMAIQKLEEAGDKVTNRKVNQKNEHDKWWGQVTAGVTSPVAKETAVKNLAQLNKLIGGEQKKIDEIEAAVANKPEFDFTLNG